MTGDDIREALKWSLLAAMIVAAWCGVAAVRKARADHGPGPRVADGSEQLFLTGEDGAPDVHLWFMSARIW